MTREERNAKQRERYAKDREKKLAYQKEYYCRPGVKEKARGNRQRWLGRNRGKEAARNRGRYVKGHRILWELKAEQGCTVCGEKDPRCLQFHHRDPTSKEYNVSRLAGSIGRALKEAEKCVVMCANCHCKLHVPDLEQ